MQRIEITRAEYEEKFGLKADAYSWGAVFYNNGVPFAEYVFIDDGPTVEWLEKLFKL